MPTLITPVENNEIRLHVQIHAPRENAQVHSYQAVVDTGAQITGITQAVVDDLGIPSYGMEVVTGIDGIPTPTFGYRIAVVIQVSAEPLNFSNAPAASHTFASGSTLNVLLLSDWDDEDADVLLGMDLLVNFHITMLGGQFIISN